jgi:hypothetical protein
MSQNPSDTEKSQNENNSPVAIRKLRSGRKMNTTPSSHSKRTRRRRNDDDVSISDASSYDYSRNRNEEEDSYNNGNINNYSNDDDVIMEDSSDDGGTARSSSIKVRRKLINTLEVLMEQDHREDNEDDDDGNRNSDEQMDPPSQQQASTSRTTSRSKRKISDVGPNHDSLQVQQESQDILPKIKRNKRQSKSGTTNATNDTPQDGTTITMDMEQTSMVVQQQETNLDREEQIQHILNNVIQNDSFESTVIQSPMITTRAPSRRPPTVPRTRTSRRSSGSHSQSYHDEQEVEVLLQHDTNRTRTTTTTTTASPTPTSDVDSEVEHLHLHMPKREEVERQEEEREEGRRDGLFHKYFNFSSDVYNGRMVVKLLSLMFMLHLSLILLLVGNHDFSLGIPYMTLLSPFCIFVDLNGSARLVWKTYERWGLLETPTNFTAEIIQKERVEEDVVYDYELVDNLELESQELELRRTRKQLEAFKREQNELKQTHEVMQMAIEQITGLTDIADSTSEFSDQQDLLRQQLLDYKEKLDSVKKDLTALEKSGDKVDILSIESLIELDSFGFFNPSLNLMHFHDIRIPGETCIDQKIILSESEEVEYATRDDINEKLDEYMDVALETYTAIHNNHGRVSSKFIMDWMDEVIDSYSRKFDMDKDLDLDHVVVPTSEESSEPNSILTTRMVKELAAKAIEIERADRTGQHDYASLRSGAQIIQSGPRRTSPSLVDSLPLVNQLLSSLRLRFYGHGAYAALEPTHPANAMGQCWSFSKESEMTKIAPKLPTAEQDAMDEEPDRGKLATLAVKFASPIWVESLVIEHPRHSNFSNRDTAIRNFRVYGFQNEDADGDGWFLGDFEYLSESDEDNQEFEVETASENGRDIPPLSSIVLAVDSNWGADYSCLYRFKVHGELANDNLK